MKRRLAVKIVFYFLMTLLFITVSVLIANPLKHVSLSEFLTFSIAALFLGALITTSLVYFSIKLNNERISLALAGGILIGLIVFPDFGSAAIGRVTTAFDPVLVTLFAFFLVTVVLNLALHIFNRRHRASP